MNGSTNKWKQTLLKYFKSEILPFIFSPPNKDSHYIGVHLAVFTEPFCSLLVKGQKTVESRFSIKCINPFESVSSGDVIFIKRAAGPVIGYFIASFTKYYYINSLDDLQTIESIYGERIMTSVSETFWIDRQNTKYSSLIGVDGLCIIDPIILDKRDRLAWVVLKSANNIKFFDS